MKTHMSTLIRLVLIITLGMASCTAPANQPAPTQPAPTPITPAQLSPTMPPLAESSPTMVVEDMIKHLNEGDSEGSLAYFADNATIYFVGMPPTGMEIYQGKEQLRAVWEDSVANHFKWEVDRISADGDIVTAKTRTWHDFTRQLGVAPNEFTDIYVVKDGKITTYSSTLSEASLAKLMPALAKVLPAAETPTPSTENPLSMMTVTLSDGTCSYTGPQALKAGEINVTWEVKDRDQKKYGLTFFSLDPDKNLVDLMAATIRSVPPEWSNLIWYQEQGPNTSQTYTVTVGVEQGPMYGVCWSKPPDLPIGNFGAVEVKP